MSRRRNRTRKPVIVEQERSQEQRRVPNIKPGATNFQPINDKVVAQMYQNFGPQKNPDAMYSPGAPIKPVPGLVPPEGPRQYAYQVGQNIAQLPRATEQYSFADLRALATMYDGIQMCQQVWFDYLSRLELTIEPVPSLMDEEMDISMYADDIQKYQDFFAYPDRDHDLHEWLCMAVRDQLTIDAVAIYVRKDRAGRPYSLDLLDASLIKPLIDDRGRKPAPPFPAYEQFVYGVPACFLTADDLIYVKESQRTDSVYGLSRVERIILRVNQALRKQTKDLARFTDGSVPEGVIEPTMDVQWSQDEIEAYEMQFNNLLSGNDEQRARVKVLPRGFSFKPTQDPDIHVDLDTFLLNVSAACHGLTMDELAMTGDSNRSVGQTQENVVYRRAMAPLVARYGKLLTHILRKYFKENRFLVKFDGYTEKEDLNLQATAYSSLVTSGILSPSRAAHLMHLPVDVDLDSPFLLAQSGPIFLKDFADPKIRAAQMQAQMAGYKQATQNPGATPGKPGLTGSSSEEIGQADEKTPPGQAKSGKAAQTPNGAKTNTSSSDDGEEEEDETGGQKRYTRTELERMLAPYKIPITVLDQQELKDAGTFVWKKGTCDCSECTQNNGEIRSAGQSYPSGATQPGGHAGCDCTMEPVESGEEAIDPRLIAAECKRWRQRALDDVKAGRPYRGFTTTIIPETAHKAIAQQLQGCHTTDEVKALFSRVKDDDSFFGLGGSGGSRLPPRRDSPVS